MNRMTTKTLMILLSVALLVASSLRAQGQETATDTPRYRDGTRLIRPTNYREWPFLGSGLGLTYATEGGSAATPPAFTNTFVNPSSYRAFMETGRWPNGTVFILEIRRSATEATPNNGGRFQAELSALEAEVKDARFPDGWAFFNFGRGTALSDAAAPLAGEAVAGCVDCHTKHTAVERTFVQFYPTLLEVARQKGTLKPGF